jgi:cell division protein FtsL
MGMFGRSQRSVFKPSVYQPGKRSRRMPRWLVLLLVGIVLGAGGVLFLQANYGPQRLTVEQSEQLHGELSTANIDRQRLQGQLEETTQQRDAARGTHGKLTTDLQQAQQQIQTLNKDLQLFEEAIPPDPRGGPIGVRSALLSRDAGQLGYHVLVMRDDAKVGGASFKGMLQFAIQGRYPNGRIDTITPDGVPMDLDRYLNLTGALPLPDGFVPRTVTIKVLDDAQKQQAMRVYYVRGTQGQAAGAPNQASATP